MLEDLQQDFRDKEIGFKNDVHRLNVECDEFKALIQRHDQKMEALQAKFEEARHQAQDLRTRLETSCKEKTEAEAKADTAQQAAQDTSTINAEVTNLKERLRLKAEELQAKVEEYVELGRAFSQSESRRIDLQVTCEQQQAEISQHVSAIDALREEHKFELSSKHIVAQAAVQQARDEVIASQKEKDEVQGKLENAQTRVSAYGNAEVTFKTERDDLHNQNVELRSAKEAIEAQLLKSQEEKRKAKQHHEESLDTLRREQERSDVVLREAEAKIRRQDAEYQKKIEFDRERYAFRLQGLVDELEETKATMANKHSAEQQESHFPAAQHTPSHISQNLQTTKNRKKVNRGTSSILNGKNPASTQSDQEIRHSGSVQREPVQTQDRILQSQQMLFDGEYQNGDYELSIVDPVTEPTEDTQNVTGMSLSNDDFARLYSSQPLRGSKARTPESTDQSSLSEAMSEEELERLKSHRSSTPLLRGQDPNGPKQISSQERVLETPMRSFKPLMSASQSSNSPDRPRSQANTASRLMPPPGKTSRHVDQSSSAPAAKRKSTGGKSKYDQSDNTYRCNRGSSPDYMHQPPPASKHTYADHGIDANARNEPRRGSSGASDHSSSQKRKSTHEPDSVPKKQRTSSQYFASSSSGSRSSSRYPIRSSAAGVRSRPQASPSLPLVSSGASRSKTQTTASGLMSRPSSRASSSGIDSQSRGQQPSTSRTSVSTRGSRATPRQPTSARQTRSQSSKFLVHFSSVPC